MPLIPFLMTTQQRHKMLNQDFAKILTKDDTVRVIDIYPKPNEKSDAKEKVKFRLKLDVNNFVASEVTVMVRDGFLVVEGKHAEKEDLHGMVTREFKGRYVLPEGCHPGSVESRMTRDGVLIVEAGESAPSDNMRQVPISVTSCYGYAKPRVVPVKEMFYIL